MKTDLPLCHEQSKDRLPCMYVLDGNFHLWFSQDHAHVAVVGVGKSYSAEDSFSLLEDIDIRRQNIRSAAAGIISVYPRDFICYSYVRYYYCLYVGLLPLHRLYNWVYSKC